MKIAIIGAGNVGKALGRRWRDTGHDIVFGVREPGAPKYSDLRDEGLAFAKVGQAAAGADVVTLATPWPASREAIGACGDLSGKILIDCTNPLKAGLAGLATAADDSGGEQVARWAKGARVVKAFNTVGSNIMEGPVMETRHAVMFLCGDEAGKPVVRELSDALGFETVDAGPLESARLLESFALLWISGAYKFGLGREYAFSLIRR